MQSMIDNLINGNLTDAKRQAKRYSENKIYEHLRSLGWSVMKATYAAGYLKGRDTFQEYCNAQ